MLSLLRLSANEEARHLIILETLTFDTQMVGLTRVCCNDGLVAKPIAQHPKEAARHGGGRSSKRDEAGGQKKED